MAYLSALYVYPVKSCRGIQLTEAHLGKRGIAYDRHWMVVDAGGRFLSQRSHPLLAQVETALTDELLLLRAPGLETLQIPLESPATDPTRTVEIWADRCQGHDAGDPAAAWFSAWLATPCRLVRIAETWVRSLDPAYAPAGTETAFADAYPLLAIGEASLTDLNGRLATSLTMDRFRPNLVIADSDPYAEDRWQTLQLGSVRLRGVKRCTRCRITTIDQASGADLGPEPLTTLATYRRTPQGIVFGQNLVHLAPGELRIGDPVAVIAEADPPF